MNEDKFKNAELAMIKVRRMAEEMKEIVQLKEYEYWLSKTDRQWLDGISNRLAKKVNVASGGKN